MRYGLSMTFRERPKVAIDLLPYNHKLAWNDQWTSGAGAYTTVNPEREAGLQAARKAARKARR